MFFPLIISYTDTYIEIIGINLTENIKCTYNDATENGIMLTNTSHGTWNVTWKDSVSIDTVVIANGTELYRRELTYAPKEYSDHRGLGVEIPNESLNWWMIDQIRALYNVLTGSDHTCETPTDYAMYNFTLDVEFLNNSDLSYHFESSRANLD